MLYEIGQLDSSAKTATKDYQTKYPESKDNIIEKIKNIHDNEHLLRFYLKYNKFFEFH